jgi:hypothetical protein
LQTKIGIGRTTPSSTETPPNRYKFCCETAGQELQKSRRSGLSFLQNESLWVKVFEVTLFAKTQPNLWLFKELFVSDHCPDVIDRATGTPSA